MKYDIGANQKVVVKPDRAEALAGKEIREAYKTGRKGQENPEHFGIWRAGSKVHGPLTCLICRAWRKGFREYSLANGKKV